MESLKAAAQRLADKAAITCWRHRDSVMSDVIQSAILEGMKLAMEEAGKDGQRYRWLRDNNDPDLWGELADINEGPTTDEQAELGASAAWDAAIDRAMKGETHD